MGETMLNNKMMQLILSLFMALGLSTVVQAGGHPGGYGKQSIAYHVNYDDAKRQAGALRNIQNHINAVGAENMDLRVIMHGKGLSMLLLSDEARHTKLPRGNADEQQQAKIDNLKSQGVAFKVCANTLKGKKISLDQLHDAQQSDVVPSGVAEVAHLQDKGFSYLRP